MGILEDVCYAEGTRRLISICFAMQALFGTLTLDVIVLTMLYSTAGLGIAIVNDFKSIEGDRCATQGPHLLAEDLPAQAKPS